MNDEPLPPAHGYPARLIVPGLYGYVSATKWLSELELTTLEAFDGYWVPLGWAKEAPILTQSRIDTPRGGVERRDRSRSPASPGPRTAGSRRSRSASTDVWREARLSRPISDATWVQWVVDWAATSGRHVIKVRATDGTGAVQPETPTPPPPDGARGWHTIYGERRLTRRVRSLAEFGIESRICHDDAISSTRPNGSWPARSAGRATGRSSSRPATAHAS